MMGREKMGKNQLQEHQKEGFFWVCLRYETVDQCFFVS